MRHNRNTFFHELTPLANAIERVTTAPTSRLPASQDRTAEGLRAHVEALEKRAAKLARRAARAGHKVPK